jgi:hypothetical protein
LNKLPDQDFRGYKEKGHDQNEVSSGFHMWDPPSNDRAKTTLLCKANDSRIKETYLSTFSKPSHNSSRAFKHLF